MKMILFMHECTMHNTQSFHLIREIPQNQSQSQKHILQIYSLKCLMTIWKASSNHNKPFQTIWFFWHLCCYWLHLPLLCIIYFTCNQKQIKSPQNGTHSEFRPNVCWVKSNKWSNEKTEQFAAQHLNIKSF